MCILLFQKSSVPPLSDVIAASRAQIIQYASLVIQGCFEKEQVKIKTVSYYVSIYDTLMFCHHYRILTVQ